MSEQDKKDWLELYEVAKRIQKLEPWNYLWDTDILQYMSKPANAIFYCSVMGRAGMHKSVAVYKDDEIYGHAELAQNDYPPHAAINYQECICCSFLSREETLEQNRKIIKELGLKFRGEWISFERFERGYEPGPINIEQVKMMTEALQNFYMMFRTIIDNNIKIDFDKKETLLRYYDEKSELYINSVMPLRVSDKAFAVAELENENIEQLLKIPQTKLELEVEFLNYLPIRIGNLKQADGRYKYSLIRLIAERKTGFMIEHEILDENSYSSKQEYITESINHLLNLFDQMGRPKKIYVRDEETEALLQEIADKLEIKLVVKPVLKSIDRVYEMFLGGMEI